MNVALTGAEQLQPSQTCSEYVYEPPKGAVTVSVDAVELPTVKFTAGAPAGGVGVAMGVKM
jgi:hypothetical protein